MDQLIANEVFVISQPQDADRRRQTEDHLVSKKIPFRFWHTERAHRSEIQTNEILDIEWQEKKLNIGADRYIENAMSHKNAYIKMLEYSSHKNLDSLLILEDDVTFNDNWREVTTRAIADLPKGWLHLHLATSTSCPSVPVTDHLHQLSGGNGLTAVLFSRLGIEATAKCLRGAKCEADEWIAKRLHPFGCSYSATPNVVTRRLGT